MLYSRSTALRCVADFYDDVPLAFAAANPYTRHASERRRCGMSLAGNTLRSRRVRVDSFLYEQITCTIEDPLGIVLTRWWLRKRSVPEFQVTQRLPEEAASPDLVEEEPSGSPRGAGESKSLLLKNCRLYLRCLGGPGVQVSKYVLSLGELMTFGIVERIDMSYFRLQATNEQLYPFLRQPVGLQVFRCRHVNVDMGELFTLLTANASTLSVIEMSSYELPTLQLFAFLPAVRELELRNATILNQPIMVYSGADKGVSEAPLADGTSGALSHLAALQSLEKLDLSSLRSNLNFSRLLGCTSLSLLNLSSSCVTNSDIAVIAKLEKLRDLFLSHTGVSDASPLGECSNLETIQLSHTDVTTKGIRTLEGLDNLRHLDLSYTMVDCVNQLAMCKNLRFLNVWKSHVTSEGICELGRQKTLQHFLAGDNEVRVVKGLRECESLRRLSLQSTLVDTDGISGLENLPQLEELNLSNTLVTDVSALCEAKALKKLDLTGARVTTEGLRKLKQLPLLSSINVSKTDVESLAELSGSPELCELIGKRCRFRSLEGAGSVPHLTTLVATHCPATSANPLKACTELMSLNLWACKITQEGISELGECRALRDVDLAETLVTCIDPLLSCTQITTLVLYSSGVTSIEGIDALRNLTRLDIANTAVVSLAPIAQCGALEVLNVSDTDINDEGFRGVEHLGSLKALLLSSTRVTRIGQIGLCTKLTEVHASKCPITSAGIEGIEGARKLEKLNLSYTEVEWGVTRLALCRWLQKLNLKFTRVSQGDIESLRSYLPKCRILAY